MSEQTVQRVAVSASIRDVSLDAYEKKELTHFLRDLKLCPVNGRVIIHFSAGSVCKVEPQPVL